MATEVMERKGTEEVVGTDLLQMESRFPTTSSVPLGPQES